MQQKRKRSRGRWTISFLSAFDAVAVLADVRKLLLGLGKCSASLDTYSLQMEARDRKDAKGNMNLSSHLKAFARLLHLDRDFAPLVSRDASRVGSRSGCRSGTGPSLKLDVARFTLFIGPSVAALGMRSLLSESPGMLMPFRFLESLKKVSSISPLQSR